VAALAGRAATGARRHGLTRQGLRATRGRDYRAVMALSASAPAVPSDIGEFTGRYVAAWNECDTAAMAELVTDDIVWADPAMAQPARGIAEVQEFMRTSFRAFPDLHFGEPDPPAVSVSGDVVFWAWYMEGTQRGPIEPPGFAPTGRRMRVDGVDQWTMRDGRIALYRAFYDMNDVARQLGIVPAAGSAPERGMVALQRLQARLTRR
jgi:steroid delta-isomerase-like uncharacterized protein